MLLETILLEREVVRVPLNVEQTYRKQYVPIVRYWSLTLTLGSVALPEIGNPLDEHPVIEHCELLS